MFEKGFSVVELVVAVAIIVLLVTAATGAWHLYFDLSNTSTQKTQAALLTEEAAEALNFYRDKSWTSYIAPLSLDTPYFIYWNGSKYATSTSAVAVNNIYQVSLVLASIYRDTNSDIVTTGGTIDNRSRKLIITVTTTAATTTPILETNLLLHDVFRN